MTDHEQTQRTAGGLFQAKEAAHAEEVREAAALEREANRANRLADAIALEQSR